MFFNNVKRNRNPGYIFPQEEQLQTSEREKQSAQQQLTRKVNVLLSFASIILFFVTAGVRADEKWRGVDEKGVRVAEGRGDYQERAAADSGDETES